MNCSLFFLHHRAVSKRYQCGKWRGGAGGDATDLKAFLSSGVGSSTTRLHASRLAVSRMRARSLSSSTSLQRGGGGRVQSNNFNVRWISCVFHPHNNLNELFVLTSRSADGASSRFTYSGMLDMFPILRVRLTDLEKKRAKNGRKSCWGSQVKK